MEEIRTKPIPARLLAAIGKALYGERWQVPLARLLGEPSPRRMQRWAAAAKDDRPYLVSEDNMAKLLAQLERRNNEVQRTFEAMKALYDGS